MRPRRAALAVFSVLASAATLFGGPGRPGTYFMLSFHTLDFRGDLTRELTLWHFEKAFLIPRLGTGQALSVGLGGKSGGGSWEVAYLRSTHTVEFESGSRTATFHAVEINGRSFFLKKFFLHPYFQGGISLPLVHVDDGSRYQGRDYDATYFGGGLNAGLGLLFDIGPSVILNIGVVYRWIGFLYVSGEGKGRDIAHLRIGFDGPLWDRFLQTESLSLTVGLGFIL